MKLSELVSSQQRWEIDRGINESVNGQFNTDRTQSELDEVKRAKTPFEALQELIDVVIVAAGGMAHAANAAGIDFEQIDDLIRTKLALNALKYSMDDWNITDPVGSINKSRQKWDSQKL